MKKKTIRAKLNRGGNRYRQIRQVDINRDRKESKVKSREKKILDNKCRKIYPIWKYDGNDVENEENQD